jgi:hypothetical protein
MAGLAYRLQLAEAKLIPVTTMRLDVVSYGSKRGDALCQAHGAKGMLL